MTWRAARSLLTLHKQLQRGSRAAPPATGADEWGLIGDAAHDPTSDHTPKNFPGWGNEIVTAGDFPNRPDLGLDAHRVLDDIRRARDPRVKYAISNDQIFSSYATSSRKAWEWGPYNPNDPRRDKHETHGHLSVVGDARADGTQPWPTIGGIEVIDLSQVVPGSAIGRGDRTIGQILGDEAKLRAVWIGELTPTQAGFGPDTPLGKLVALAKAGPAQPATVELTDADREDIAERVAAKLGELRFVPDGAPTS